MVCAVANCQNSFLGMGRTSSHRFPKKDSVLLETWINFCQRKDPINLKTARICSFHFEKECFIRKNNRKVRLKRDAIPTIAIAQQGGTYQFQEPIKESISSFAKFDKHVVEHGSITTKSAKVCIFCESPCYSENDSSSIYKDALKWNTSQMFIILNMLGE